MSVLHSRSADRALGAFCAGNDPVVAAMQARAEREEFPTVGREVGRFLAWWVGVTDVERVFECGSGFGYSAYWIAKALPRDGQVVLTEIDRDELEDAKTYLERGGLRDRARFEHGDALEVLSAESETYDLILLDHENERYREGFELARDHLSPGGTIIADNVLHSWEFGPDEIAEGIGGSESQDGNCSLEGMLEYYRHVTQHPEFDTYLFPMGEGLLVSGERTSRPRSP